MIGFAGGSIPHVPLNLVLLNSRSMIGIEWGAWVMRDPAGNNAMLAEIFAMIERGTLHPVEPEARPLADAASVLSDIEQRRVVGKVVLTP